MTKDEALVKLVEATPEELMQFDEMISGWLQRGDQALVYQNMELGHPQAGHVQIVSYGSGRSTIPRSQFERPPQTLPDFPGQINWRYQLIGVVDGQAE